MNTDFLIKEFLDNPRQWNEGIYRIVTSKTDRLTIAGSKFHKIFEREDSNFSVFFLNFHKKEQAERIKNRLIILEDLGVDLHNKNHFTLK